jgi:hypothetical protein
MWEGMAREMADPAPLGSPITTVVPPARRTSRNACGRVRPVPSCWKASSYDLGQNSG